MTNKYRNYINLTSSNLSLSILDTFWKPLDRSWIYGPEYLSNKSQNCGQFFCKFFIKEFINCTIRSCTTIYCNLFLLTWTCQFSWSSSLLTRTFSSPSGPEVGVTIHETRSSLIKASSCLLVTFFILKSRFFAFLHLCSKFVSISYAAGPSILQCKSCQGSLGP